jgi:hypothetical protein
LLLDMLALVRSGHYSPAVLSQLAAFRGEDNPNVWTALSMVLLALDKVVQGTPGNEQFRSFAEGLVSPAMDAAGWDPRPHDGHLDLIKRSTIVALVGRFSRRAADLDEARRRFDAFCADPTGPVGAAACPTEFRQTILQMALLEGGAEQYHALKAAYSKLQTDADRKHVMFALGHTSVPALRQQAMEWAISGAVKLQDFFYTLMSVSSSGSAGLAAAWEFYQANFVKLASMTSGTPSLMANTIIACCGGFSTAERAAEVEAFFAKNPLPANAKRLQQVLEGIRVSAAFGARLVEGGATTEQFWAQAASA